ncbi:hypothetical protein KP509_01G055500 [Ceratopteris richardii]|nr:hypothetical protein KP509_01G055500 [Ceratopteris richardii]
MDSHKEVYEMTCPKLMIRFFPKLGNEWVGKSSVKCCTTGLEADLFFHSRSLFNCKGRVGQISGKVLDLSSQNPFFDISGFYNGVVTIENRQTKETCVLFDAHKSLANLKQLEVQNRKDVIDTESLVIWREVMWGIMMRDWGHARKAKQIIEEKQRAAANEMKKQGVQWNSSNFELVDGDWQWRHVGQNVTKAPIVIPCGWCQS